MHATNSNTIHALKNFPAALLRNHVKTATGNKKSGFESLMFIHMCSVNRVECISLQQILYMMLLSVRSSVAAMTYNDAKTILKLRCNCQVVWTYFFYAVCLCSFRKQGCKSLWQYRVPSGKRDHQMVSLGIYCPCNANAFYICACHKCVMTKHEQKW